MSNEIKQGDKVRVSKDVPELYTMYGATDWEAVESTVDKIDGDAAFIKYFNEDIDEFTYLVVPTKYLVKVDAEAKEAKYHEGEKVRYNGYVYEVEGLVGKDRYALKGLNFDLHEDMIAPYEPYTEPTEQTEKTDTDNFKKEAEEWANEVSNAIKEFGDAACKIIIDAHNEAYWDAYTADLAKELVTILVRTRSNDLNKVAKMSVDIAKAVVEGLKRK